MRLPWSKRGKSVEVEEARVTLEARIHLNAALPG